MNNISDFHDEVSVSKMENLPKVLILNENCKVLCIEKNDTPSNRWWQTILARNLSKYKNFFTKSKKK